MLDIAREIFQTLSNNRLRTVLTGLSIAWGIFMLIILLGMSRGVYNSFNTGFMSQGSNTIQIWNNLTTLPYQGYKEGRSITMTTDDATRITDENRSHVARSLPSIQSDAVTVSTGRDYISTSYQGVYPELLSTLGRELVAGRFINTMDIDRQRKVLVMAERDALQLFDSAEQAVGEYVKIGDLLFRVVGVYTDKHARDMYVPFTTAQMLAGGSDDIFSMLVEVKDISTASQGDALEKDVKTTLARAHDFDPDDSGGVWIWNRFSQHLQMQKSLGILQIAIWVIGIFTMLSGIIGVSNIMFVSVKERTHEIGIRRAIGATPRKILMQIILESIFLTTLFGYVGIVAGIGVTELLSGVFADGDFIKDPTVTLSIALDVTLVLVVAGCLAGLFPALRAIKVKPIEALRAE